MHVRQNFHCDGPKCGQTDGKRTQGHSALFVPRGGQCGRGQGQAGHGGGHTGSGTAGGQIPGSPENWSVVGEQKLRTGGGRRIQSR